MCVYVCVHLQVKRETVAKEADWKPIDKRKRKRKIIKTCTNSLWILHCHAQFIHCPKLGNWQGKVCFFGNKSNTQKSLCQFTLHVCTEWAKLHFGNLVRYATSNRLSQLSTVLYLCLTNSEINRWLEIKAHVVLCKSCGQHSKWWTC